MGQILNPKFIETIHEIKGKTKEDKDREPYELDLYEVNIVGFTTKMVFGKAANIPFGTINDEDKFTLGNECRRVL